MITKCQHLASIERGSGCDGGRLVMDGDLGLWVGEKGKAHRSTSSPRSFSMMRDGGIVAIGFLYWILCRDPGFCVSKNNMAVEPSVPRLLQCATDLGFNPRFLGALLRAISSNLYKLPTPATSLFQRFTY